MDANVAIKTEWDVSWMDITVVVTVIAYIHTDIMIFFLIPIHPSIS